MTVITLPGGRRIDYDRLTSEQQAKVDAALAEYQELKRRNPLEGFEPHSPQQREFLWAKTGIVAAQAGNRFGKTTVVLIRGCVECLPGEFVPGHLGGIKQFEPPVYGWILCPTEDKIHDTFLPAVRKWVPQSALKGGNLDRAWNGERNQLTFACGSHIAVKTYKQDPSTLESAAVHWVAYDEPPPREHREACATRLLDYGGYEMFAYTPLRANTGYIKREIFKKRSSPDITFVQGSMHDNPLLDEATKKRVLAIYSNDLWRRAREFGDFVDVGGLIYEDFERCVVKEPWSAEFVGSLDVVVGIDPGIRNAGFVWAGFDKNNVAYVFDELLIQDGTVPSYVAAIKSVNQRWGITDPVYVIDPAARQRGQVNATTVKTELAVHGIYTGDGQNDVEAGIQQIRGRIQATPRRFWVSPSCVGLRDEADEYAAEDREDGSFKPEKGHDHRLDALRYVCMTHVWEAHREAAEAAPALGWQPGFAPPHESLRLPVSAPPMGFMS